MKQTELRGPLNLAEPQLETVLPLRAPSNGAVKNSYAVPDRVRFQEIPVPDYWDFD